MNGCSISVAKPTVSVSYTHLYTNKVNCPFINKSVKQFFVGFSIKHYFIIHLLIRVNRIIFKLVSKDNVAGRIEAPQAYREPPLGNH